MKFVIACIQCVLCLTVLGQEVVKNKMKATHKLELTEELRFGAEGEDDNFIWGSLDTRILPGPAGQMYIFDFQGNRVLAFTKDGNFAKVVASPGNGPGELSRLLNVSQMADGSFMVVDAAGFVPVLKQYDANMTYVKNVDIQGLGLTPMVVSVSPDGKYLGGQFVKMDMATRSANILTGVVDMAQKKMINEMVSFPMAIPDRSRMQEPAMWEEFMALQFKTLYSFGVLGFSNDSQVYAGKSEKYLLSRYKPGEEKPNQQFELDFKTRPFGEKQREETVEHVWGNLPGPARAMVSKELMKRAIDKADLPPIKAPLVSVIPLENKGVLVISDVDIASRATSGDIFDNNGKYLCSIDMADNGLASLSPTKLSQRIVFHDGLAYTILTDEDGDNHAVRYRYSLSSM